MVDAAQANITIIISRHENVEAGKEIFHFIFGTQVTKVGATLSLALINMAPIPAGTTHREEVVFIGDKTSVHQSTWLQNSHKRLLELVPITWIDVIEHLIGEEKVQALILDASKISTGSHHVIIAMVLVQAFCDIDGDTTGIHPHHLVAQ